MPATANITVIDAARPQSDLIAQAAQAMAEGKVGIFPTRCLYGLGTNALNPKAVARVFAVKNRPAEKPLLVLISKIEQLDTLTKTISPLARKMMSHFWPGKVTFLLSARPGLPQGLVGPDGKLGVRLVAHAVAAALVEKAGIPITGTSANLSGHPGCHRIDQMPLEIIRKVDLVLDAGELLGGIGSSIVDATLPKPKMIRRGVLSEEKFQNALAQLQ